MRYTSDKPWVTDYFRQLIPQRRAMKIMVPELGYHAACSKHLLDDTYVRRENLSKNFSPPSISHHIDYTICYRNRNRINTPSGIHQNFLSRILAQTGLRTL